MTDMEYLDASQACQILGVKRNTLYGYVSNGVLQSYRRGIHRSTLYRRDEVEALLCIRPTKVPVPSLQGGGHHFEESAGLLTAEYPTTA